MPGEVLLDLGVRIFVCNAWKRSSHLTYAFYACAHGHWHCHANGLRSENEVETEETALEKAGKRKNCMSLKIATKTHL